VTSNFLKNLHRCSICLYRSIETESSVDWNSQLLKIPWNISKLLMNRNDCHQYDLICSIHFGSESLQVFFVVSLYMYCLGDPVNKRDGLDPINRFHPFTFLCLSQARAWISNVICCGLLLCSVSEGERWLFSEWRWEVIVQWVKVRGDCLVR
jgi:hypothetical protein